VMGHGSKALGITGFLIVTVLAGCSTQASTGTIMGRLDILEGGSAYRMVPGNGKLVIHQGSQLVATERVLSGHPFEISLPTGTYTVTSSALNAPCQLGAVPAALPQQGPVTVTVTVTADKASRVEWSCPIPSAIG
jgi:hypothetical protein